MKKKVVEVNTKVWAKADLDGDDSKSKKKQQSPSKNELAKQLKSISKDEYNKLFHQATLSAAAEVEGKSFQDLQEEDMKKVEEDDQKEKEIEQKLAQKSADPLNKEGSQMNGENPESMGDVKMEETM